MSDQGTRRSRAHPLKRPLAVTVLSALMVAGAGPLGITRAAGDTAPPGTIRTVAGMAVGKFSYGFSGDGGPATSAQLFNPRAIAFDKAGNTYVADAMNFRIRRITPAGTITTIAGNGQEGFSGDGGAALNARLSQVHGVAVDSKGNLYLADSGNNRIRRVTPQGVISTIAGTGEADGGGDGGPATAARLKMPKTLAVDANDHLYIADSGNHMVRKIDLSTNIITRVAGVTAARGFSGDGLRADRAHLDLPHGVAVGPNGAVFIADTGNDRVRKVANGIITTVAGTGIAGHSGDGGPATAARMNDPRSVILDNAGTLYIGEEAGHRIRKVTPAGTISTIAGNGIAGFSGDGGPAVNARVNTVRAISLDAAGHLWIADTFNNRIRIIFANSSGSGAGNPGGSPGGSPGGTAPWTPPSRSGYWMLGSDGRIYPFGDAKSLGDASAALPAGVSAVHVEPTPTYDGYWILDSRGRVLTFGDASQYGNVPAAQLHAGEQVTSLSATPTGGGYWLFTTQGRVFPFGDAAFHGDMSGVALNGPVLSSVASPTGGGYYMVASDGGVFSFGDASFYGSMGDIPLNQPVQSLVPSSSNRGYWLVASDGGIFAFGDSPFRGSMGDTPLNQPVVGMVRFGNGYLMVASDGGIFNFSDRPFSGSLGDNPPVHPVVAAATLDIR